MRKVIIVNPKVYVLLSTYNGEKYLQQQVNSILKQNHVDVILCVRDDGSNDNTVGILKEYNKLRNVDVDFANNIGWKKSFTELLHRVSLIENAYYAFADQDDVWKENKLYKAIQKLSDEVPMVYHSNVSQTDGNLNYLGERFSTNFKPSCIFPNYFFDGYGVGSTIVFNSKLLKIVQQYKPTKATNHDAMIMLLGNLFGKVVYDSKSYIQYRRHEDSATAFSSLRSSGKPTLAERYKRYKNGPKNQFSVRARQIVDGYSNELDEQKLSVFKHVAFYQKNFLYKVMILLDPMIKASGLRKTLQIKYRVLKNTL